MCAECRQIPCDGRCPNAPEPRGNYVCEYCGEWIVSEEQYFTVDETKYHLDCISITDGADLEKFLGATIEKQAVEICSICEDQIEQEGVMLNGELFHLDCLTQLDIRELLEIAEIEIEEEF